MIIKCKFNSGKDLRMYEEHILLPEQFGRFGASEYTDYGLDIGEEFFVVCMVLESGNLQYLIKSDQLIGAYPYQLFEVIDSRIPAGWLFNSFPNGHIQAVWGYQEWCFSHEEHYEKLVDMEEDAHLIFFKHMVAFENSLMSPPC